MREKALILILAVVATMTALAAPIGKEDAERKAKAFWLAKRPGRQPALAIAPQGRRKARGQTATDTYFYVFNNGQDEGFVVMAADDCAHEVLGYADSGSIDMDNLPENLQAWLDGYAEEIAKVRATENANLSAPAQASQATNSNEEPQYAKKVVAPMLTTKWDQVAPYNQQCFTNDGAQASAGCVAVALAQLMYYHKWPRNATKEIPAYSITENNTTVASYGKLAATTFAWDKMRDVYSSNDDATDESVAAVSKLMLYCGHAVKMNYGINSSGAVVSDCCDALGSYFGYSSKGYVVNRNCFGDAEWENIIHNELCHGRPVIYSGRTLKDKGHSFIIDGYDGEGLYHANWGWGGLANGYFRLQVVNPSTKSIGSSVTVGYSIDQSALVGMSPTATENNSLLGADNTGRLQVTQFTLAKGAASVYNYTSTSTFSNVKVSLYYKSPIDGKYDLGFGLFKDGELKEVRTIVSRTVLASSTYTYGSTALGSIGGKLADGTYQVKCVSRLTGSTQWLVDVDGDKRFLEVVIANGKATFTPKVIQPKLAFVSLQQLYGGAATRRLFRVTARNTGDAQFNDQLVLYVGGTLYGKENLSLGIGKEDYVDFVFTYSAANIDVKVTVDDTGEVLYENNSFSIKNIEPGAIDMVSSNMMCVDNTNMKMLGTMAETVVDLKNNSNKETVDRVKLFVYYYTDDTNYTYTQTTENVCLAPGESQTVRLCYRPLTVGQRVWFVVQTTKASKSFGSRTKPYTVVSAYQEWDGSGQRTAKEMSSTVKVSASAAAVSFEGTSLTGVTITANSNPNTLYYLDADATTPSRLSGKNVVKGFKAASISLSDGYNFYVPKAFEVEGTASYSRTAASACDGRTGWQTIVLPFAVAKVTAGGTAVSLGGGNGGLWLRKWSSVSGDLLACDDETDWKPNMPYLMGTPAGMVGKKMVFSATAVKIHPTVSSVVRYADYDFIGTTAKQTLTKAYVLNSAGDAFTLTSNAVVNAFRTCFVAHALTNGSPAALRLNANLRGDVNGDGMLSVSDVMLLATYVTNGSATGIVLANADVNGDGDYTVADIMQLVNIIVKGG